MRTLCCFFLMSYICPIGVFCVESARSSSCSLAISRIYFNYCLILQNLSFKERAKNRLVTVSTSSHLLFFRVPARLTIFSWSCTSNAVGGKPASV